MLTVNQSVHNKPRQAQHVATMDTRVHGNDVRGGLRIQTPSDGCQEIALQTSSLRLGTRRREITHFQIFTEQIL